MNFFKFCILFFIVPFVGFSQEESFYKKVSELTVGKFLYDKNIKIVNDSIDILIRVNTKGYCYAVDFVSNDKIKFTLSNERIGVKVDKSLVWVYNDSIIEESLQHDEYQSCGDYLSHRGRNHRYDSYVNHANSKDLIYIILNSEYGYAILVEPSNSDFLTETSEGEGNGKSIPSDWISFKTLEEGMNFLKSEEFVSKGNQLKQVQDEIYKKNEEINKLPISSVELPYKIHLGMTEQELEKHLMSLFGNFKKHIEDELTYKEAINKGIYKIIRYDIYDHETLLRIVIKLFHDKAFFVEYSHLDKNISSIEELDHKIKNKFEQIESVFSQLFDIDIQYNNRIWSKKEKLNFEKEEKNLMDSIYEANREKQNKIGNKM